MIDHVVGTIVCVGLIIIVGIVIYIAYDSYGLDEGDEDMAKPQQDRGGPSNHKRFNAIEKQLVDLKRLLSYLIDLSLWSNDKESHLIDHAHHLEALIKAIGNPAADQAKLQEASDKLKAGTDKVTAAIKALTPPAGDTSQP
jgi:hypothetical protein